MSTRVYYDDAGNITSIFTCNDPTYLALQQSTQSYLDIEDATLHPADMDNTTVDVVTHRIKKKGSK
jgi:hypothetical protein